MNKKNISILLSLTILNAGQSHATNANDIGLCRYDLVGPMVMQDTIHEKNNMSVADCKKAAIKMLQLNQENYNKAIIRHEKHPKPFIVSINE